MDAQDLLNPTSRKNALVIVAHPDDEILWIGGTILNRLHWTWHIVTLCRKNDRDRAPRFSRILNQLRATGAMGDLDDGPDQKPLADHEVEETILPLLVDRSFDIIFTHGPRGEYTRHRRHEETCRAVTRLWAKDQIACRSLMMFGFEDGGRAYFPRPTPTATHQETLTEAVWLKKYKMITDSYGFSPTSWEAQVTPRTEAFWSFYQPQDALTWVTKNGVQNEDPAAL